MVEGRYYRLQFCISIHALRVEGDLISGSQPPPRRYFYPRPPGGGRRGDHLINGDFVRISIHALRVEGDISPLFGLSFTDPISIHALRVEGDHS